MKYVAFLRGINVGGKSLVKMAELKKCMEDAGFQNVLTYINSGNVIFESDEKNTESLVEKIEKLLTKKFGFELRIVLRSEKEMKEVVDSVPRDWDTRSDLRFYVAFIKEPMTVDEVFAETDPHVGIDFIEKGPGVVYMATLLSSLTKSWINKLLAKKIYKEITIRNYNTTKKILALMEG